MKTEKNKLSLQFLGGAGSVTGSKTLLQFNDHAILIDCGLFQGVAALRALNRSEFPFPAVDIEAVILTHGHLDHCGYLPLLVKNGFSGTVYCTPPTKEITELILKDSGKIQEEEAMRANRYGYSKHNPALPLYTIKDAEAVSEHFNTLNYNEWVIIDKDCKFRFMNSGHILGSAFIEIACFGKTFLFSGDMGRENPLLLYPPKRIKSCDYLILESTYGGRLHEKMSSKDHLKNAIMDTLKKRGVLLIPAFAVERSQEIIYLINELKQAGEIPELPVYLDSPMGVNATEIMLQYPGWTKLAENVCRDMCLSVKLIRDADSSRAVVNDNSPKIVLAGSGMIEGGRILHYLEKYVENPNCMVLLVGFQAEGTRGRALLEGATEIKFFGKNKEVKAEVRHINSLSAHADQSDIMNWLSAFHKMPEKIFLNHGEPIQSDALKLKIKETFQLVCEIPVINSKYELDV